MTPLNGGTNDSDDREEIAGPSYGTILPAGQESSRYLKIYSALDEWAV